MSEMIELGLLLFELTKHQSTAVDLPFHHALLKLIIRLNCLFCTFLFHASCYLSSVPSRNLYGFPPAPCQSYSTISRLQFVCLYFLILFSLVFNFFVPHFYSQKLFWFHTTLSFFMFYLTSAFGFPSFSSHMTHIFFYKFLIFYSFYHATEYTYNYFQSKRVSIYN